MLTRFQTVGVCVLFVFWIFSPCLVQLAADWDLVENRKSRCSSCCLAEAFIFISKRCKFVWNRAQSWSVVGFPSLVDFDRGCHWKDGTHSTVCLSFCLSPLFVSLSLSFYVSVCQSVSVSLYSVSVSLSISLERVGIGNTFQSLWRI